MNSFIIKSVKNIIPKITEHLEVWHEKESDPGKAKLKELGLDDDEIKQLTGV